MKRDGKSAISSSREEQGQGWLPCLRHLEPDLLGTLNDKLGSYHGETLWSGGDILRRPRSRQRPLQDNFYVADPACILSKVLSAAGFPRMLYLPGDRGAKPRQGGIASVAKQSSMSRLNRDALKDDITICRPEESRPVGTTKGLGRGPHPRFFASGSE